MDIALAAVLDAIARAVLGDASDGSSDPAADRATDDANVLGAVTLRPHQRDALRRVRASIERTGGALLADEPGLGKTFVALALAGEHHGALVVAPAALRAMWREAATAARVDVRFVSLERLSRRDLDVEQAASLGAHDGRLGVRAVARAPQPALVIVDEAHHVCNPAAARYGRLARLVANSRVLLLSATPVRNRGAELDALLALFLGSRAALLDDAERSRCIVRRAGDAALLPAIDGPHWHRVRAARGVRAAIASLPPALPALDGRRATALVGMTLVRCSASSLAALDVALKRRLQRGAALDALLHAGRVPTRGELRAWVVGDDAVQLAFPMLVAHETANAAALRAVLDSHLAAVRALRARIRPLVDRDALARARLLLELRRAHGGARIVAFTAHAATAEAIYRALSSERGVALLTARGARTAGGARPRADVIGALAGSPAAGAAGPRVVAADGSRALPAAGARDDISLVIATDLLSEGVNLQGASVIVHLDVPWTPAALDQRVGRAARMGSRHACVHVHGFAPPAAAEHVLTLGRRLERKHAAQAEAARPPRELEELRALVRAWRATRACRATCAGRAVSARCAPGARGALGRTSRQASLDVQPNVPSDVQVAEGREQEGKWTSRSRGDPGSFVACAAHVQTEPRSTLVATALAAHRGFIAVVSEREEIVLVGGRLVEGRCRRRDHWRISDAPGAILAAARSARASDAVDPDPALESSARAALAKWLAARRARADSGAAQKPSRARRRLLARIDRVAALAGAHQRAALAHRVAHLRALVDRAVSAGSERTLDELARATTADTESWLASCETRLGGGGAPHGASITDARESGVRALLLLRPRG